MKTKLKFIQKRKSLLGFILPILFLAMIGCSSDDDEKVQQGDLKDLEGYYIGTWNSVTPSSTYTDFGISAKIRVSDSNEITGAFFYTTSFEVCCSEGDNDGTFTMKVDDKTITSFRLDDIQTDCSGVFTGRGTLREGDDALVIDFTGDDCKGDHVGQIILVKR